MNKERRKDIDTLIEQLEGIELTVQELRDQEEDTKGNLPEGLQDGERGEAMQEAMDALEEAADNIQEAMDNLTGAKGETQQIRRR